MKSVKLLAALSTILWAAAQPSQATSQSNVQATAAVWRVSAYMGWANPAPLSKILSLQEWSLADYQIGVLALSKEIASDPGWTRLDVEGQLGFHFQAPLRTELNLAVIARWVKFPWTHWVTTSLAMGGGVSQTFGPTRFELDTQPATSNLLHYLVFELALGPGSEPRLELFGRVHHRSGVFGLLNGVWGGSDYVCLGARWALN
jgi:hypothetical protein